MRRLCVSSNAESKKLCWRNLHIWIFPNMQIRFPRWVCEDSLRKSALAFGQSAGRSCSKRSMMSASGWTSSGPAIHSYPTDDTHGSVCAYKWLSCSIWTSSKEETLLKDGRKKASVPLKLKSLSLSASREEGAAVLDYSQSQQQQAPHTGKSPEKSFALPQLVLIG